MISYQEQEGQTRVYLDFAREHHGLNCNTMRGFKLASAELGFSSIDNFINYIRGKHILDLGSGFNGLAMETYLRGLNTSVISVNPSYKTAHFNLQRQESKRHWPGFLGYSEEQIDAAEKYSATKTCRALAHALPFFDESFDVVIDCIAVSAYFTEEDAPLYLQSLLEMLRVTKKGGKIRIGACDYFIEEGYWKGDLIRNLGQKYEATDGGIEITKEPLL